MQRATDFDHAIRGVSVLRMVFISDQRHGYKDQDENDHTQYCQQAPFGVEGSYLVQRLRMITTKEKDQSSP